MILHEKLYIRLQYLIEIQHKSIFYKKTNKIGF